MANVSFPCTSLYVGDLHPDVTEAILRERFIEYGNVVSIRVCRDLLTRKSLGYAYVNYQTGAEAKNALDNLNYEDIHGRPCRIMWSQRDPATRQSGLGNIFVKNLDPTITVKEIHDTFAAFGEITTCKVQCDDNGASKGFAFVNFLREEDAAKAIQIINGKMIRDKIVYVAKFVPRNQRTIGTKEYTNCFIKNFGTYLNEDGLRELFSPFGSIVSAKVMLDNNGVSKGFGFVSFHENEQAMKAVEELNGHLIQDKTIYVGRAMKRAERTRQMRCQKARQEGLQHHKSGVNLYIKNFSNDFNDDRLHQEFAVFGNITSAKVMINRETNVSKGFGFVCFSEPDEATRAASDMHGKLVDGKPLYVVLAQKKEERMAHLRSQFQQRVNQAQPQPMFNQGMMNFMMNQPNPRPFMPRVPINMQPRWPGNMPAYLQPMNNMMAMQSNQGIMIGGMPPQRNQSQRNIVIDPIMAQQQQQQRNARPITGGNLQLTHVRPPYNMVATGTRAGGAMPYPFMGMADNANDMKMEPQIEAQIDLNTTSKIANAEYNDAKQLLGEKIYPLVSKHAGDIAGKITGMLLELDNAELLYMIENEESLRMKIDEAMTVLSVHKADHVHPQH